MDIMEKVEFQSKLESIMEELQSEWNEEKIHLKQRYKEGSGIRSSQISALVGLLIKKGILT